MAVLLSSGFEILRFSDVAFVEITAEIQYRRQTVAQLNLDKGIEEMEIEFFTESYSRFDLADLLEAIEVAKGVLQDYAAAGSPKD